MKRFVKITAVVVALLVAAVTGLWMTVPPQRSVAQHAAANAGAAVLA